MAPSALPWRRNRPGTSDDVRRPQGVIQIGCALGIPKASASLLLRSLARLGYLHLAPSTRTYQCHDADRIACQPGRAATAAWRLADRRDAEAASGNRLSGGTRDTQRLDVQFLHLEQISGSLSSVHASVGSKLPLSRSVAYPMVRIDEFIERIKRNRKVRFVFDCSETTLPHQPCSGRGNVNQHGSTCAVDRRLTRPEPAAAFASGRQSRARKR